MRFENSDGIIIDNKTTLHYITSMDWEINLIVRLMNDLNDENEELKEYKQNIQKVLSDYWKKDNGYLSAKNVIQLIMRELGMDLIL